MNDSSSSPVALAPTAAPVGQHLLDRHYQRRHGPAACHDQADR